MMRIFLFLGLFLCAIWASDFSKKKLIKIDEGQDNFELINLDQARSTPPLDSQKALFDSSALKEKQSAIRDKKLDFAIVFTSRRPFSYPSPQGSKNLSHTFSQNTLRALRLNFVNAAANGIYQSQKTLKSFSPQDASLINIAPFLRQEKDRGKIYADFVDYLIIINLNEFYISTTNFIFTQKTGANAVINFKLISAKGEVKSKNITLKIALDEDASPRQNYQKVLDEMPKMLAQVVHRQTRRLKVQ